MKINQAIERLKKLFSGEIADSQNQLPPIAAASDLRKKSRFIHNGERTFFEIPKDGRGQIEVKFTEK